MQQQDQEQNQQNIDVNIPKLILGIESSCDETALALYGEEGLIADVLYSQVDLHALYGGVVPELASRDHLERLSQLMDLLWQKAPQYQLSQVKAISYTQGPGLPGCLLVGGQYAMSIAGTLQIPVIPIHHLEGHILSAFLQNEIGNTNNNIEVNDTVTYPFVTLLVSGGHTQLFYVKALGDYELLGDTLDDAAGEAFDKTAALLGFSYPGGKKLAELATQGNRDVYKDSIPRPLLHRHDAMFSFSGLKTAVLQLVKNGAGQANQQDKADLAAGIETAIIDVLVKKAIFALNDKKCHRLVIAGGVSANEYLRYRLSELQGLSIKQAYDLLYSAKKSHQNIKRNIKENKSSQYQQKNHQLQKNTLQTYFPPLKYCTDNAAMIAFAGFQRWEQRVFNYSLTTKSRWELKNQ